MNPFFPVNSIIANTTDGVSNFQRIPDGGPLIRISREVNIGRLFVKFGDASLIFTTVDDMVELINGVTEEFLNPDPSKYSHFLAVVSPGSPSCAIAVSCSPRYFQKKKRRKGTL